MGHRSIWGKLLGVYRGIIYLSFLMEEMNPSESKWQLAAIIRLSPHFLETFERHMPGT